jgi:hypothetical protein
VLDEKMGDKVKVTVIATGFQRDAAAEIDRRSPHFPFSITTSPEMNGEHIPSERVASEGLGVASEAPMFEAAPEPVSTPQKEESPGMPDFEVPAYLRKQRRLVQ